MKKYINNYNLFKRLIESEGLLLEGEGNAGEATEGVVGAILIYYNDKVPNIIPDKKELDEIFDILKATAGKEGALFQKNDDLHLDNEDVLVAAFSAAKAISDFLKHKKIVNVWRTGRTWPKELVELGLNSIGGRNYNSADIIIDHGNNDYTGISLKAKMRLTAQDPTIINKSLSAIISKDVKDDLIKTMTEYFEDICKEPLEELSKLDNDIFKKMKKTYKSLFSKNIKNEVVPEILVKKYTDKKDNMRAVDFARNIINKKLYDKKNKFYSEVRRVLRAEVTPTFAETIYDSIFKPKIKDFDLEANHLNFILILVTGIQKYDSKSKKDIDGKKIVPGEVQDYPTMINLLTKLAEKTNKISILFSDTQVSENSDEEETTSAIYGTLTLGDFPLADICLRFKGNFASLSGLTFTATLSKEFKKKLNENI